ncbi:PAS domain S-box protein [Thermodesulfobacteriota bacterium]
MTEARILIVEDEPVLTMALSRSLKNLSYEVVGAVTSGRDCVRMAEESKPDLILMDINLEGDMDGIETADRIRSKFDIPVVYLTGYAEKDVLDRAKKTEPFGYLGKPVTMLELRSTIETALYKHEMERRLKESERRYRQIVENANDSIHKTDAKGFFVLVNPVTVLRTGYSEEELIGTHCFELVHPDYRRQARRFFASQFADRIPETYYEFPILTKEGETVWVGQNTQMNMEGDRIVGFQSIARDITDRKKVEETLKESEVRYRELFDNAIDFIYTHDLDGNYTSVNNTVERILGYSREEFLRLNFRDLLDPGYLAITEEHFRKKTDGTVDRTGPYETLLRSKDGRPVWVEVTSRIIRKNGKPVGVHGAGRDITARKQVEEALQKAHDELEKRVEERTAELARANEALQHNERELSAIYHSAPLMMILLGQDHRILKANRAAVEGAGIHLPEVIGLRGGEFLKCVHAMDDPRGCGFGVDCESCVLRNTLLNTFKTGKAHHRVEAPILIDRGDGPVEVHVLASTCPVEVLGERNVLVSVEDITERKKADEVLQQSEANYRTIFDNAGDAVFVHDLEGNFLDVNRVACERLGYSKEELLTMTVIDVDNAADAEEVPDRINAVKETGHLFFETVHVSKNGISIPSEITSRLVDYGGRTAVLSLVRDITERKKSEDGIQKAASLLRATLESTADGILVVDNSGTWTTFNEKFLEIWHIPAAISNLMDSRKALEFVQDQLKNPPAFLEKVKELYNQPEAESFDLLEFNNGRIIERYSIPQKIRDEVVGRVWSFRDVTLNKRSETALKQAHHALEKRVEERTAELRELNEQLNKEIAERSRAAEALRGSEDRFRALSEATFEAIFLSDKGICIGQNLTAEKMLGYSTEEAIGRSGTEWFAPDYREMVVNNMLSGYEKPYEAHALRKDGSTFPCEIQGKMLRYEGRWIRVAALRDISDRKEAEEALKESENRYPILTENSLTGIYTHQDGVFTFVNRRLAEMMGYSVEEMVGRKFWEFVHPEDRERIKERGLAISKGDRLSSTTEFRVLCKNGETKWLEVFSHPVNLRRCTVNMGNVVDITGRWKAEEALRESDVRYRAILGTTIDGFVVGDTTATIMEVNDAFCQMTGYSREELIGMTILQLEAIETPEETALHLQKIMEEGSDLFETAHRRKDGSLVQIELSARFLPIAGGRIFAFARDITDRKKAEDQIKASLTEKEVMLREIHHRVKNNFALVCSLLKLQAEYADATHHGLFEELEARVISMAMAHEKLYKSESLADLNLNEYVDGLIDHLVGSTELGFSVQLRKEIRDVSFGLDTAIPLGFILTELVSNCLKHAYPDGREGEIRISLRSIPNDQFELVVSDNGIGIPEDMDMWNQTSLGMDLVQAFADKLQGEIEIVRDNGTKARLIFREI